jgi:hypothetical protein
VAARSVRRKPDPAGLSPAPVGAVKVSPARKAQCAPDGVRRQGFHASPTSSLINAFLSGGRQPAAAVAILELPGPTQARTPAMVDVAVLRHMLGLRRALHAQRAPIRPDGLPADDDAPVARPSAAELGYKSWWRGLRRLALADADTLMLAAWVFVHTTINPKQPDAAAAIAQFLDELLAVAPRYNAATTAASLDALKAKANQRRGRGRPTGRTVSDTDIAAAREISQRRFVDGDQHHPAALEDPWEVLWDVGAALDALAANDRGVSNTPHLRQADGKYKSSLRKAWFGDAQRGLPSLRRWFLAELLAVLCLIAWDDMFQTETGRRPLLSA